MPEAVDTENTSSNALIEPDIFWDIIEKILRYSATDERNRIRQNISMSALCKVQAISPLTRPVKTLGNKNYNRNFNRNVIENPLALPNSVSRNRKPVCPRTEKVGSSAEENKYRNEDIAELAQVQGNEITPQKQTPEVLNKIIIQRGDNAELKKEESEALKTDDVLKEENKKAAPQKEETSVSDTSPKKTKSECSLDTLHAQLLNDENVPASERLWRFAMQNKKRADDENSKRTESSSKVRSNEAIYKGLQQRLNEAVKEADQRGGPRAKAEMNKTVLKIDKARPKEPKQQTFLTCIHAQECPNQNLAKQFLSNFTDTMATDPTRPVQFRKTLESISKDALRIKPIAISRQQDFNDRKTQYDSVVKQRLSCGSQLEYLNKEMVGKGSPRSVLNNETIKKYNELKTEYLSLCSKESRLRHQIALIHAEIYMMQNKGYHKTPASVKTITLDPETTPFQTKIGVCLEDQSPLLSDCCPYFPPLKPPRPLLKSHAGQERSAEKQNPLKHKISQDKIHVELHDELATEIPRHHRNLGSASLCSLYSLTPAKTRTNPYQGKQAERRKKLTSLQS